MYGLMIAIFVLLIFYVVSADKEAYFINRLHSEFSMEKLRQGEVYGEKSKRERYMNSLFQ